MLTIWKNSPTYPPLLENIHDPPPRLFCIGQDINPKDKFFAIVGTRHPSRYGEEMTKVFSSALAKHFVIVSGLAYGIDAIAHKAALDAGGRTVAILGSGVNRIVPRCNAKLAKEILKTGSIISEYEPDRFPFQGSFPRRNRIIAGMSFATLVIEAPEKSGALITARLAVEYGRDIFAVPGNITQETSKGVNQFIRDSRANIVTCVDDIFEYYKLGGEPIKSVDESLLIALNQDERIIYELLKKSSLAIDQLVLEAKLSAQRVSEILSVLELKGLITMMGCYAFITR
jgi:DNA processing protein